MDIFQDDRPPELFVPDLTRPAGAAIDADGNVTCVTCGTKLPVAKADVVGQGYRCPPCSAKADLAKLTGGPSDIAANLSDGDRAGMRAFGAKFIGLGILMAVGGGLGYGAIGPFRVFGYLLVAGLGSIFFGVTRYTAAR